MYGVKKIRPTLDKIVVEVREKTEFRGGKTVLAMLLQDGLNVLQIERFLWNGRTLLIEE